MYRLNVQVTAYERQTGAWSGHVTHYKTLGLQFLYTSRLYQF